MMRFAAEWPNGKVEQMIQHCAVNDLAEFRFGHALHPVRCGRDLSIGTGTVIPEINFTLPPMTVDKGNWGTVRSHYEEMIQGVLERSVRLRVPGLLVEFETLPDMTSNPDWALEITRLIADRLDEFYIRHRLRSALRLTPNDTREFQRPPRLRGGIHWDNMMEIFTKSAGAGADLIGIESTGGKEICDEALVLADLHGIVFALGVLGARDMAFLWTYIVSACRRGGIIPSGDTACGFANTAMVLAEKKMIPSVLAAVVRVASVPRSLVAYEVGAVGPSKDCAYEGPYMKAIAGVPISMEGRTSACAHLSPVGNVSQAVCDCWSNESVQNVQLLSGKAPTVSLEQLAYDCRLLNTAGSESGQGSARLRNWLADSDSALDPQAYVLRPDVVLRISREIMKEKTSYRRTVAAVRAAIDEISNAHRAGRVEIEDREILWLEDMKRQADTLPATEDELIGAMNGGPLADTFIPEEYGMDVSKTPEETEACTKGI